MVRSVVAPSALLVLFLQIPSGVEAGPILFPVGPASADETLQDLFHIEPVDAVPCAVRKRLQAALEDFQQGDVDRSLEHLNAAAEAHASLSPGLLMLARLSFATGQLPQGRLALERAAVAAPRHPEVSLAFGDLALFDGRLADAQLQFQHAARLIAADPSPPRARTWRAQVCAGLAAVAERRHDWETASTELVRWLEIEPHDVQARQRLAQALFQQQQYDGAFEQLARAREDDPRLEPAEVTMGRLFHRAGQQDRADEWFRRALQQESDNPRVHLAMVLWSLETGQADRAEEHLDQVAERNPDLPDLLRLRGVIARHRRDFSAAERYLEALVHDQPGDFDATNQLALVLIEQPDDARRRRALQLAAVNARQYPRSAEALATLGWILHRMDRSAEAENVLRAAISGGRASSDTAYCLALVLLERGHAEEARLLLEGALAAYGPFLHRAEAGERLKELNRRPAFTDAPARSRPELPD